MLNDFLRGDLACDWNQGQEQKDGRWGGHTERTLHDDPRVVLSLPE